MTQKYNHGSLVLGLEFLYFYFIGIGAGRDALTVRKLKIGRDKGGERENETRKIESLVDFAMRNAQNCPKTSPLQSGSYIGAHVATLAGSLL